MKAHKDLLILCGFFAVLLAVALSYRIGEAEGIKKGKIQVTIYDPLPLTNEIVQEAMKEANMMITHIGIEYNDIPPVKKAEPIKIQVSYEKDGTNVND